MINLITLFQNKLFNPTISVTIILPTKDRSGTVIPDYQTKHDVMLESIARQFGGYTRIDGKCGWYNGTLIEESNFIVTVWGKRNQLVEYFITLAHAVKSDLNQDAVYLQVSNHAPQFI